MWSPEEKENIIKLLLSVDESNRKLAIELLKNIDNTDEFAAAIFFLSYCDYYLNEEPDFQELIGKISSEEQQKWELKAGFIKAAYSYHKTPLKESLEIYEKEASAIFDDFFSMAPQYADVYNTMGNRLINIRQKKKGLEYLHKAVELRPDSYSFNFDYAYNLSETRKNAAISIRHYQKCLEIKDIGIAPYHNMGRLYSHQLGNYKKASEILQKGLQKYPDATDTMIEVALAEENLGNLQTAREFLNLAIEKNPYNDLAHNNLAFLLWQHFQEYELAKEHINKALELKPKDGLYWHTLAEVEWYGFQNREKALQALYKGKEVQKSYKGGDKMIAELEEK